jgi:hypothetical protein
VDTTKVEAIMEWLAPTNVPKVCSFMGIVGYYRRFIEGFFFEDSEYDYRIAKKNKKLYGSRNAQNNFEG